MIPNWIIQRSMLTPDRIAVRFEGQAWTYKEINELALQRASQLVSLGIKSHDRVAIYATSTPQIIFMICGCMHLQCEMVLLNLRLSKLELAYQIEDSEVVAILAEDSLLEKLPKAKVQTYPFSKVSDTPLTKFTPMLEWSEEDTLTIMYTSGTTGFPKGVRQTVGNHVSNATSSLYNTGLIEDDAWLCAVPLFHISGFSMLCKCLLHGVRLELYTKFDVKKIVDQLVDGTVTRMSVVAVTLERILTELERRDKYVSNRFQTMLAGGGPVPIDYLKRAIERKIRVSQTYGMTETASQTSTLSSEDALRKIGSAGKPLFFNQIRIDGANQPFEQGEILIRGAHVTPGYVGRFAHKPSQKNGWLHSGDIGYLDEEGYLFVVDRRSDLIISGGENIYPAEIENVLISHPSVREAGVCGIEDEKWGQVPNAFVVLKNDVTTEELVVFCKEHLAAYKVPKKIYIVKELPRNGSNKLLRRKLQELIL
ncbi:o-succinylbenzoate--CoA ligase [Rummeliibacillus sp. SL167]|uniref:o-succinylbenzoate--CoA ligase n=1 Tax=Rummeliibacillus sp. SL167 TaxID=2579792 RepID=UPI0011B6EED2|nr:o-succinylbenzoate--CoA ligase [Rummeliibacillus sp. SL167]